LAEPLERLFSRLSELATLPALAVRIIDAAAQTDNSALELTRLIEHDPVLTTRLMRLANSAYFSQSQQVDSIGRAVSLLGNRRLANLAATVIVARQFLSQPHPDGLSRERLWKHSAAVAALAQLIAERTGAEDPERAYLAGLLHDFGVLMIDQMLPRQMSAVMQAMELRGCLTQAVHDVLRFRPEQLGGYAIRRSNLPIAIAEAVEWHRTPRDCDESHRMLADIVHFADYLSVRCGVGIFEVRRKQPPCEAVKKRLGIDETMLGELWPAVEQRVGEVQHFALE
jgi:HD-like signal output (HDOD) protein